MGLLNTIRAGIVLSLGAVAAAHFGPDIMKWWEDVSTEKPQSPQKPPIQHINPFLDAQKVYNDDPSHSAGEMGRLLKYSTITLFKPVYRNQTHMGYLVHLGPITVDWYPPVVQTEDDNWHTYQARKRTTDDFWNKLAKKKLNVAPVNDRLFFFLPAGASILYQQYFFRDHRVDENNWRIVLKAGERDEPSMTLLSWLGKGRSSPNVEGPVATPCVPGELRTLREKTGLVFGGQDRVPADENSELRKHLLHALHQGKIFVEPVTYLNIANNNICAMAGGYK